MRQALLLLALTGCGYASNGAPVRSEQAELQASMGRRDAPPPPPANEPAPMAREKSPATPGADNSIAATKTEALSRAEPARLAPLEAPKDADHGSGKKDKSKELSEVHGVLGALGASGTSLGDDGTAGLGLRGTGAGGGGRGAGNGAVLGGVAVGGKLANKPRTETVVVMQASGAAMAERKVAVGPTGRVAPVTSMDRVVQLQPITIEGGGEEAETPEQAPVLAANGWVETAKDRLSTFGADVDTASYTEARRALREGRMPAPATVRVEEFINFFKYEYPSPEGGPFGVQLDVAPSPVEAKTQLLRIGIQAKRVAMRDRKVAHLTFLVDTSGSMSGPDRLPLAKQSLKLMLRNLKENDTVSLVTYAGGTRDVLAPTPASEIATIERAIDSLSSGGGTAMGSGMELAYGHAVKMLKPNEISRVIVLTDGDANIGASSHEGILEAISKHVKEGVTLSTVGFGTGNYRDHLLEQLADKGNGNAVYIDSMTQARRVFEEQLGGLLEVVAKDVKFQVEFDPAVVERYRLVGYENRDIADHDFRNDRVDSGDVGAGHAVTAIYAVQLKGEGRALGNLRIREKAPNGEKAEEQLHPLTAANWHGSVNAAPRTFRLATAAALLAEGLRGHGTARYDQVDRLLAELPQDGDVTELRSLAKRAAELSSPK